MLHILFIDCSVKNQDDKIKKAIDKIQKWTGKVFNYKTIKKEPITCADLEYTTWNVGRYYYLGGKFIEKMLDKVDEADIAPIVVFLIDPMENYPIVNLTYKLGNKYGAVCCSCICDDYADCYIAHELVHAIHEVIWRNGVQLPDTQDDAIVSHNITDWNQRELIEKQNLSDCIPYLSLLDNLPKEWQKAFQKHLTLITLLTQLLELITQLFQIKNKKHLIDEAKKWAAIYNIDYKELCATIEAESNWNPRAVNINKDGSKDVGIAQINETWWIGSNSRAAQAREYYFPSEEYIFTNPERCISWMAQQWSKGRQNDWYAYSSGKYKQYLKNY